MAWQHSSEASVKSFKKCYISNAMDETCVGILWNGSEEDGNVRNECQRH